MDIDQLIRETSIKELMDATSNIDSRFLERLMRVLIGRIHINELMGLDYGDKQQDEESNDEY